MAPGSLSYYIASLLFTSHFVYYFAIFTFQSIQQKYQKYLSYYLYQITFASGREGIDNPFIALVARFLIACVGTRELRVISYWIDTLVLKN